MTTPELDRFLDILQEQRGPLTTERLRCLRDGLRVFAGCDSVAQLVTDAVPDVVLYRGPEDGPLLLAHLAVEETYRVPHDHGRGWVLYAVVDGVMEIGTWSLVEQDGGSQLVRRDLSRATAGDVRVFLPGDIHDTRVLSRTVRMLRLTSCDLAAERAEGRTRSFDSFQA